MDINLNLPKTIVFHPGIGKTATSAIQKIGLGLPTKEKNKACFSPFGVYGYAHNYFASNHPGYKEDIFQKEWQQLLNFAKSREASTVVSSEFLIRDKPSHIKYLIESAKEAGLDVKVVVSVRNYVDYLISAFLQGVKVQWGIRNDDSIFTFCERELDNIRMNRLADHWARHLGDENVFLIDYDKDRSVIVEKFFDLFGITIEDGKPKKETVNSSICLEAFPMIRHFDRVSADPEQRQEFIAYVCSLSFNSTFKTNVENRVKNQIVGAAFTHDIDILSKRYTWV
ncbi:hypothetical protein [Vibrio natriegens]|uniref:hypothetical protein n=1 Tax=Vibrio natriegens TaxID=691 RepID=UPI003B5BF4A5